MRSIQAQDHCVAISAVEQQDRVQSYDSQVLSSMQEAA